MLLYIECVCVNIMNMLVIQFLVVFAIIVVLSRYNRFSVHVFMNKNLL